MKLAKKLKNWLLAISIAIILTILDNYGYFNWLKRSVGKLINPVKHRSQTVIWIIAFVSIIALFLAISSLFNKAIVTLEPKNVDFVLDNTFSTSSDGKKVDIPYEVMVVSDSVERIVQATDLKEVYSAPSEAAASLALNRFGDKWDIKYPTIHRQWKSVWHNLITLFDYPEDIRKVIYTTNAIESLNRSLRKVIKTKGAFPSDASIMKIFYMALANISKKWTMPIRTWNAAISQFAIKFAGRFEL